MSPTPGEFRTSPCDVIFSESYHVFAKGERVLTPYGLDIIEDCLSCKMRAEHIFCDLPASALKSFEEIKYATAYPKGAVLFVEGQAPRGIFVLCKGRVK